MRTFLILRLDGPMQAWGTHTFEDYRPSGLYPTRSGLLGLLGSCLGLERNDLAEQQSLSASVEFTVRVDSKRIGQDQEATVIESRKLLDFHTVMDARKVDGSVNKFPVVSSREYLYDAVFTVAIGSRDGARFGLDQIAEVLRRPCYTPTLGRRSCPLTRPLFVSFCEADTARIALSSFEPNEGLIYCEAEPSAQLLRARDVPLHGRKRQFGTRIVYLHQPESTSMETPCT